METTLLVGTAFPSGGANFVFFLFIWCVMLKIMLKNEFFSLIVKYSAPF